MEREKKCYKQESHWSTTAHVRSCRVEDIVCFSLSPCLFTKNPLIQLENLENIPASLSSCVLTKPRHISSYTQRIGNPVSAI